MADQKLESQIHDSLHPSDNQTSSSAIVSSEEVSSSTEMLVVHSPATSYYPFININQPQHVTEFLSQLINHFSTNTISYGSTVNQIIHVHNHQLAGFVFHVLARQQQAAPNQSIIFYTIGPQNTSQSFTLTINESPEAIGFVTFILNLSMPQLARLLQAAPIQSYLLYTNESYEAVFSLGFIFNLVVSQYAISQSFDHNLVYTSTTPDLSYITESSDRITEIEHEDVNRLQENNPGLDSASTTIPPSSHQPSPFNLEQVIVDIPDNPSIQSSSPIHRVEIFGDCLPEQPLNDARQAPPLSWSNYLALIIVGVHVYTATSLLSIPYAINESGWCGFFIFISFFGVLTYFTSLLLPSIIGKNWNRTDYVSLGSAAWGQIGRRISIVILCLFSYATCIDSVMVDRDNWVLLFPQHPVILTVVKVLILSVIVCFITIDDFNPWLPSMGVILTFVVIVCLLLLGISDTGFHGENQKKFNGKSMHMAFGFLGYCYAGHSYMPKVYTLIRNKKAYGITLLIIYCISTAIYVAKGALGYSMFGGNVNSMVTLNLPLDSYISIVAICCTLVHHAIIFISNLTSLATTVEGLLPHDDNNNLTSRIVIRFGFGMLSLLAIFITPYYGSFLSLSGSIIGVIVSLIFPAVLRIRNGGMTLTQMIFCWFAIVAAIITTGFTCIRSFYLYLYE